MSEDLRISSQLQQLLVVVRQIEKLKNEKDEQSHKNRLKLLIKVNNILSKNKNIKIKNASTQIGPIIDPSLQQQQDKASFLYNILFIFITQTLDYEAKLVHTEGFKNLHITFANHNIMQFFQKDVLFSNGELDVDHRNKFIDGLQWIVYKAFSQLKNNIYYAALNNVMRKISQKQEIFICFNFNVVSDCFLFISEVAFNLDKPKLMSLLIKIFKQINKITQNSQKFKQLSKNISVNTHKQLKSYIETIMKQIERDVNPAGSSRELVNKLKEQIEITLNAMGLNLLSNQSIEKRLIGLRMMYHDIINEQIYFQWIKSKNVFQLILKETSHNAFVDSSGFIFKLVIRHLKNNKSYLSKIIQYINNSTPQIRKSVLKHIQNSSIFQYVPLYGQILQKLLTNQNPEFYTSQLIDLISKLLPKASYHHNSIIIRKLIKVYLELSSVNIKSQKKYVISKCKDLINSSLVRNLQKKTSSSGEENQKFNTVFSIYESLLTEPLNIEKICLSNSITKKIIQKFSITKEQKQRIIQYLLKEKKIIENSMRWMTEWSDGRLKQEIQNFFCTLVEDLAQKTKNGLIENTEILIEATASYNIFKKLIVMFDGKRAYLKDNFADFISKAYSKNYPSTFMCISQYFFYINQNKINYKSKILECGPQELVGIDVLKSALRSSEISIQRDDIAQFISYLYTNYSDVVRGKCQKYLQSTFTQISKQFSNEWFLSSAQGQFNGMLGYLALVDYLMIATEFCGVGVHKSFNQLVPINYITVMAKNQAKKSSQYRMFETRLPSNMLFFDALVLICYHFDYDISLVQIRNDNKVLDKNWNSISLEYMNIDGKILQVSTMKQKQKQPILLNKSRRERIISDNKQLSPKALKALTQVYYHFCPKGVMTETQCIQFTKGVTKSTYVGKTDTRIQNFMKEYDQNKDGIISLQDFIRFYHDRADQSSSGDIWVNLKNMGYRYDLRKLKSPIDPLPDRLMLRTYLAKEQQIYDTLFQMLRLDHEELKVRTIKILRRLPQYKGFLQKFEQNSEFSFKDIFQIEYYLILIQKDIMQKGGAQRAKQYFQNRRTEIIFQIMTNFLAKQTNSFENKKCFFLSIKILRSLCSIQNLMYPPSYKIYSSEFYLSHLKNLDYKLFIKKIHQCLQEKNIQQIQCMITLLLQQNLIKKERDINKLGLDEAFKGIFHNIPQIRQITCNFIYFLSINKQINKNFEFKEKINSFFLIKVQKNSQFWFETLMNIIHANQYDIDFNRIIDRCLSQLKERKQSLQNPYDEIIEGYLLLLQTIKKKRNNQLSFQRMVNIAENVYFSRSRKHLYHILSMIDYDYTIFYVKQLILNVKKCPQKQIIPKNYYIGFNNLGSTCYINSILQLFFSIKSFRKQIITMEIKKQMQQFDKCADQGQQLLDEIIKLCVYLQHGHNKFYDMTKFCQLYKNKNFQPIDIKKQEDAHEFYGLFLEVMEVYFQKSQKKDIFERLFTGKTAYQYICTQCQHQKIKQQPFSCLTLQIKQHRTLEDSLDNFTKRQQIQDYNCENCNKKVKVRKQTKFWEVPQYLTMSLKRIFFDFSKYKNVKISSKLQFPQTLDLKKYAFSSQVTSEDEYVYQLKAVVIHSGSCLSGHYYSIIKMKQKWFKFDDQNVSEYNVKELQNEGYGTGEQENEIDQEYPRSKNAYILCYKKTKIKQQEIKQSYPSPQLIKDVQQQKMFMIDKLKIYNDSIFQFCADLFDALELQQQTQLYNKQWKNDENCQNYNIIFELSETLLYFLQTFWKLSNTDLIPKLYSQISSLLYRIPQKSCDFIAKLNTNDITEMLCFHPSNQVKQVYKHILTKSVHIFYDYKGFNFESDDQVARKFFGIIAQLMDLFNDENFCQHISKLQMFLQFWKVMLDCVANFQSYLLRSNLLIYLIKIITYDYCGKQNGQIDDSMSQKQKSLPESIGKIVCNLICTIMKYKNFLIEQNTQYFGKKISININLTQQQIEMLRNGELYSNILRYNIDKQKVLSMTISKLADQNEQFSKQISLVFLKGFKIYEKKTQNFLTMLHYLKNFLTINDNLRWNRYKWILGIWQLEMGHQYEFGFKQKDINSNLYRYVSNLYISQSNKYPPILQLLTQFDSNQPKNAVLLLTFMIELTMVDDIALIYLKRSPSPSCIYKNYFDWIQSLKQKLVYLQQINFPQDKSSFIERFIDYYSDLKQRIKNDSGTQQLEKSYPPLIVGRNHKFNKVKQNQYRKYLLNLYSHETYILENLPNGKQNLSIPTNFFSKPESKYFLSKYQKYNQVNNKSYKQMFKKQLTVLTLQISSQYDLRIELNLKYFKEQIYTIAGRSTINFPYQNLQQSTWNNFLTVDVIQNISPERNRKFSEEIKMKSNKPFVSIIEENRQYNKYKQCSKCTLHNQLQAKQCEACGNEFY